MRLNEKIAEIPPSATLAITARARQLKAEGRTIYNFAAGEPDFDTPDEIKEACVQALLSGRTKYAPVAGTPELRQAIAEKLREENGLTCEPGQVVVSNGAKHSLYNVLRTLCREGDEVIIPSPYWLSYPEMVRVAGGCPAFVECREEAGLKMTPDQFEAAITERTVAVILNSPANPTGMVYTEEELGELAEVALRHNLYIVADEIYEKIVYEGRKHFSIGSISTEIEAHTITVNGFSKAFAMTGWRLGYFSAPPEIARVVSAFQSHTTSGANTFAQAGALAALRMPAEILLPMQKAFADRRDMLYAGLSSIDGLLCVKPMGTFYMLPNIGRLGLDSMEFAKRLLEEEGTAVVPGVPFGAGDFIRLSYACSLETIEQGIAGLQRFVGGL
jgi:aspartate aminotransferase